MTRKKLIRKADIEDALRLIIAEHNSIESDAWLADGVRSTKCWGWGTIAHAGKPEPCVDCDDPDGHLVHSSGVVFCWRCAFWRHMVWCPHAARLAGTQKTPA